MNIKESTIEPCVGAKAQDGKMRRIMITTATMGIIFNLQNSALFDSNGRHISEVQTDSQGDVIDRVVGSTLRSLSDKSTPKTDFIPERRAETLLPSKYGRKRVRVERDDSTPVNNLD